MKKKALEYGMILIFALVCSLLVRYFIYRESHLAHSDLSKQSAISNLARRWNDLYYEPKRDRQPSQDVVIVAVDESSLIEVGRWPWSRSIINQITENLFKYGAKTVSFDIIFSEGETRDIDGTLAKTFVKNQDKIILGTFSDYRRNSGFPYQDYCLTQAFLFTGGNELVKVNPFFTVIDEFNPYEEINFNEFFTPVFNRINQKSENTFIVQHNVKSLSQLSKYQLNSLEHFKASSIYDYCNRWLTEDDEYNFEYNAQIEKIYEQILNVQDANSVRVALDPLKNSQASLAIPQYIMWRQNVNAIQQAAIYTASFVAHPDDDGIIRHYPLIFRTGNQLGSSYIPAMGLQAYLAATGNQVQFKVDIRGNQKIVTSTGIYDIEKQDNNLVFEIPVDEQGKMLVNFYGKQNAIAYVSAKDILNESSSLEYRLRRDFNGREFTIEKIPQEKATFLKGKNIILGATATAIYDIRNIPNDINYPGPEIHATALSNLLERDFLRYAKDEINQIPFLLFIFITLNLLVFLKLQDRLGLLYFAISAVILVVFQNYQFKNGVVYQSSMLWIIIHVGSYILAMFYKYFFETRKNNEIKRAFSKYVSKDLVDQILKNADAIELRGQKFHMSVYFSDIRGFTPISEKMDPVELSEFLNKYFTPMSNIITEFKGTIDKYIGDAIMAMFGAPINYEDHAIYACLAALKCKEELKNLNIEFAKRGWPEIKIGIGVNSGYMNAGNIGSNTIQNYTVIGDSVNLASRIQNLNKDYGTEIIISQFTFELVQGRFNCRLLDEVQVRGKSEPIKIYELVSQKN